MTDQLPIADGNDRFRNIVQHDNPALALIRYFLARLHVEAG